MMGLGKGDPGLQIWSFLVSMLNFWGVVVNDHGFKKYPTGPTEQTLKPEFLMALATY